MQTLVVTDDPGMTGFRESLVTRVLGVVEPARFLPILTYTGPDSGKKEIAAAVFDIELPSPRTTSRPAAVAGQAGTKVNSPARTPAANAVHSASV